MTDRDAALILLDECDRDGNGAVALELFKLHCTVHEWAHVPNERGLWDDRIINRATVSAESGSFRHVAEFKDGTTLEDFIACVLQVIEHVKNCEGLRAMQGLDGP